jgi:hypothetical protein
MWRSTFERQAVRAIWSRDAVLAEVHAWTTAGFRRIERLRAALPRG